MISKLLRWAAIAASLVMVMSFAMFAIDEGGQASQAQVKAIDGADPSSANEQLRQAKHDRFREAIDDANDALSKPFAWVTEDSGSLWVQRGVTILLGLLVYGLGGAWLANVIPRRKPAEPSAWQT